MTEGRDKFRAFLNERRKERIKETSAKWEKLPANIRAAVAKVAGVENIRLDNMSAKDREAMYQAADKLRKQVERAWYVLVAARFPD